MKSLKENFQKSRIVIIGSGIIGKFNALELSELGFQVTIIDPNEFHNSSYAALGLLMGNMYQKRRGKSWDLRKQSIELWPQWITFLQKFNYELNIEKPLIQLTTNEEKFKKLEKFVYENNDPTLLILERDSILIKNINKAFQTKNIKGMISFNDGRINGLLSCGLLEGLLIVAQSVIDELQTLADSSSNEKRSKGRRGLKLLKELRDLYG